MSNVSFALIDRLGISHKLDNVDSCQIISSMDSPCISITLNANVKSQLEPAHKIYAYINNVVYALLYVDVEKYTYSLGEIKYHLEARSSGYQLLDREALPSKYQNVGFAEIANTYISDCSDIGNNINQSITIPEFNVGCSKSRWQVACDFCLQAFQQLPYISKNQISVYKPNNPKLISNIIKSFKINTKNCNIISHVYIQGEKGLYFNQFINQDAQHTLREKYIVPKSYWQNLEAGANKIIKDSMAKYYTLNIEFIGIAEINIAQDFILEFNSNTYKNFTATEVSYTLEKGQFITAISAVQSKYL